MGYKSGDIFKILLLEQFSQSYVTIEELKKKDIDSDTRLVLDRLIVKMSNAIDELSNLDCSANELVDRFNGLITELDTIISRVRSGEELNKNYDMIIDVFGVHAEVLDKIMNSGGVIAEFYKRISEIYSTHQNDLIDIKNMLIKLNDIRRLILNKHNIIEDKESTYNDMMDFLMNTKNCYDGDILNIVNILMAYEISKCIHFDKNIKNGIKEIKLRYSNMVKDTFFDYINALISKVDNPVLLIGMLGGKIYAHITLKKNDELLDFPWCSNMQLNQRDRAMCVVKHLSGILNRYGVNRNKISKLEIINSESLNDRPLYELIIVDMLHDIIDVLLNGSNERVRIRER